MPQNREELDRRYTFAPALMPRLEARDEGGVQVIRGHAAVYFNPADPGTEYRLWEDYVERVMPGAFDRAIREDDVRALYNHNPDHLLGRSTAGTLKLWSDDVGLAYEIDPPASGIGGQVKESLGRGDLTGSSFAFVITDQNYREENELFVREILGVRLFDVGPVTFPAYTSSGSGLARRSFEAWKSSCTAPARPRIARAKRRFAIR